MELGGNAPFLVFEDADLDAAVEGAMLAKMRNIGEACTAANRFHVHESVADEFAERLAERMGALKVGRGTEDGVDVGPLIDDDQRGKVRRAGRRRGRSAARAALRRRRARSTARGYFYAPTVLADVPRRRAAAARGDLRPGRADRDVRRPRTRRSRPPTDTEYGLVAYVYTRDLDRALRVIEALETGMVGLNQGLVSNAAAPFGGVKQSGFGREGGAEGIDEYLAIKYVAIKARRRSRRAARLEPAALPHRDPRVARERRVGLRASAEREDRAAAVGHELLVDAGVAEAGGRRRGRVGRRTGWTRRHYTF